MLLISIIFNFLVFFVSIFLAFTFNRNKASGYISLASWFFVAVGLAYGLGAAYIFNYLDSGGQFADSDIVTQYSSYWWIHGALSLVLIFSFLLGWMLPIKNSIVYKRLADKTYNLNDKQIFRLAVFIFIISFLLRYLYVDAYGGFFDYLEYNRRIRSGIFEINNFFSFLEPFGALSFFASYMFFSLILKKNRVYFVFPLFVISLLFSLYVSYSYAGRVGFLIFISVFCLTVLYKKNISLNFLLAVAVTFIPFGLAFIFYISNVFELKGGDDLGYFIIKEIRHLFVGFFVQIDQGFLYRGFTDFLLAPLHLLPSSLTSGLFETASQANTKLIQGNIKGEGGVTGGIPVDILTLSIMQLNVFGVVFTGALFGWFLKRLEFFISLISNDELRYVFATYISLRIAFIGTLYAQPPHLVSGLFVPVFLFFLFYLFNLFTRVSLK